MTDDERQIVVALGEVTNKYLELDQYHPADRRDWIHHVHALQNIVMSRTAVRSNADLFVKDDT